ncbi:uncharacterized protein UBRO_05833 [Ustilago bromivora]|uniref:Ras modification protein ERF4 n=1 Tax=Ustilago bromivora TaxID=307758 RepID=A0A1K0GV68_9BASI|nr:uncharacterized protein UBRO_05833 [Ustilago bromivora]
MVDVEKPTTTTTPTQISPPKDSDAFYALPTSSYYFGPPISTSAFGEPVTGTPTIHLPKEIVRVERDYSAGELPQFHSSFPLELEGRISPTAFGEIINDLNSALISAHNPTKTWIDNSAAILSFYLTSLVFGTHYQREMKELEEWIGKTNKEQLEKVGLRMKNPKGCGWQFVEIEYF